ncbi:hypothetical protein [Natronorubrum sp. DTA7]|uniref:hypothetical protein n=1 Tax=Natronorubrum sp. DTA7 TaxID=3447016 RepID=UPI003F82861D
MHSKQSLRPEAKWLACVGYTTAIEVPMSFTINSDASEQLVQEAEQIHEYFIDQLGYATYDVDIVIRGDDTLEITVSPGATAPSNWPVDVLEVYRSLSKRERSRLDRHYCQPARIRDELERIADADSRVERGWK